MEPVIVKEEHIEKFAALSTQLGKVLAAAAPDFKKDLPSLVSAECIQCAMSITGDELLQIADLSVEQPGAKVKRLRQGYCARQGCNSYFYKIKFLPHPSIDWPKALTVADAPIQPVVSEAAAALDAATISKRAAQREYWVRASIALAILAVALLGWHWFRGGAIPVVRSPEKFKIGVQTTNEVRQKFVE